MDDWRDLLHKLRNPDHELGIAVVGKYAEHHDAYKSIYEALDHAGHCPAGADPHPTHPERRGRTRRTRTLAGRLRRRCSCPGGFGERGIEGKVEAIRFARERGIPFFGICLGMQCAAMEFARNVVGPGRRQFAPRSQGHAPSGDLPAGRAEVASPTKGAPCGWARKKRCSSPSSHAAKAYRRTRIFERHRHRYEFNNVYRNQFAAHGMQFAGTSPDGSLVEVIELPAHPWFVAVQFHPEFKSKPTAAHPLVRRLHRRRDRPPHSYAANARAKWKCRSRHVFELANVCIARHQPGAPARVFPRLQRNQRTLAGASGWCWWRHAEEHCRVVWCANNGSYSGRHGTDATLCGSTTIVSQKSSIMRITLMN